jgi:phospholipid/cholesterol/gamma-HCH transport system substrate-binding protein
LVVSVRARRWPLAQDEGQLMERQARFVLMGSFVLAFAAAVFGAVYWLHGIGTFGTTAVYTIRFQGVAPGIGVGGSVLFNGVRVGEVTSIRFNPADPNQVLATIAIDRKTPVRTDTQVGVETTGLMGGGVVSLRGGAAASPAPSGIGGAPPMLEADPALVVGLTETARQALQHIDQILTNDADPLHSTLSNLQVFSDALARNSGRVDGILQGIERMTGGGPAKAPMPTYELAVPTSFPSLKKIPGRLAVAEPTAVVMYEAQRILLKSKDGGFTFLEDAQWSDSLPKLVQAKLVQAYENAQLFASVDRPLDGVAPDDQLLIDIRSFSVLASPAPSADVALAAKLMSVDGKIVAERIFHRSVPIPTTANADAILGLNNAFVGVETDLIAWTSESL